MSARAKIAALEAQIAAINVKIEELRPAADAEIDFNSITVGSTVTANYGRGDKARVIVGVVKGVHNTGKQLLFKVETGTGFDTELVTVLANAVTAVSPASE